MPFINKHSILQKLCKILQFKLQFLYGILLLSNIMSLNRSQKMASVFMLLKANIWQVLCINQNSKNIYLKRCMYMGKVNYNIEIKYGNQDLKNIILQIFEEYCSNKILKKD